MTRENAMKKYNYNVEKNINYLNNNTYELVDLPDPDTTSAYDIKILDLSIKLSQDGLCGNKAINMFAEDCKADYKLIRENMFDCLVWPAYAMSINQLRYAIYKDRIDLQLMDIKKFYDVVNIKTELSIETITAIEGKEKRNCDLFRAYIFPHTFYWLRSFDNFKVFIRERKLSAFIDKDGEPREWVNERGFCADYYNELIKRVKDYRRINKK